MKRWLIPVWNAGMHTARSARDYLAAVLSGRVEHCAVCARRCLMLYRKQIIPRRLVELWGISPALAESFARKESCFCSNCGANLRARRIAEALLTTFPVGSAPAAANSLAEWVTSREAAALRIAEINWIDGVHDRLINLPHFLSSDYHPGATPGSSVNGVRSEDLTRLTYSDSSLDLVLTSETLEHVPNLQTALSELHRVLAPGGRHIFTIPQLPGVSETFTRSVVRPDGSIEDRAPRICHPGGDVGYLVFTEFGSDAPKIFEQAGFELEVFFGPNCDQDVAQVYVARKPRAI